MKTPTEVVTFRITPDVAQKLRLSAQAQQCTLGVLLERLLFPPEEENTGSLATQVAKLTTQLKATPSKREVESMIQTAVDKVRQGY